MGIGESEAIALAIESKAQLVAIDDRKGIQACRFTGVSFTPAIGILVRCLQIGLVDRMQALEKLSSLAKLARYKPSILENAKLQLEKLP